MRYWLSTGDGKSYGPYDVAELQSFATIDRIDATTLICAEGGSEWVSATTVVAMGAKSTATAPAAPPAFPNAVGRVWTPLSYLGPIACTLCCCLIGGIVSMVYAANANSLGSAGSIAEAELAAKKSRSWLIWSAAVGAAISLIYGILVLFAGSNR